MEREITTFVADIRGFTTLSERESPQRVREEINVFFAAACDLLIENDALVDKFIGDAIMAFFNAPIPLPDHRETALLTAISLQEKMETFDLPFAIGIGLNTGLALTGNVGRSAVTDYTALGDPVNIASRLSGLARGGEILAGDDTLVHPDEQVPSNYSYEHLSLRVKGKERVVNAYRIYRMI